MSSCCGSQPCACAVAGTSLSLVVPFVPFARWCVFAPLSVAVPEPRPRHTSTHLDTPRHWPRHPRHPRHTFSFPDSMLRRCVEAIASTPSKPRHLDSRLDVHASTLIDELEPHVLYDHHQPGIRIHTNTHIDSVHEPSDSWGNGKGSAGRNSTETHSRQGRASTPVVEDTRRPRHKPPVTTNQGSESIGILTLTQCMNPVTVESMAKALQGEIQLKHAHVKAGPRQTTPRHKAQTASTPVISQNPPRSQFLIFPTSIEF